MLDREVAVKIVRPAAGGVANTIDQAKALARATHPNVVTVYYVSRITEPASGEEVDCVVMELIPGSTLSERLEGPKFTLPELKVIGQGMINGLEHIHSREMVHGDLHTDNIMLHAGGVKIIDILYRKSLAAFSTAPRMQIIRLDLLSLRSLLQHIISHSELDPAEATEFNNLLTGDAGIKEVRQAFNKVTDELVVENMARQLDHAFRRLIDVGFIAGQEYADALAEETPVGITAPLLDRVFANNAYREQHDSYVQILWARLSLKEKTEVLKTLGDAIDRETPAGNWWPPVAALMPLGEEGWNTLSKATRLRLEGLIVNDVLTGRFNIYNTKNVSGILGTYATAFYRYFTMPGLDQLVDNIIVMLRQSWYTQNYIGTYFIDHLDSIATLARRQVEMIEPLAIAVRNKAIRIKSNLHHLPQEWRDEVNKLVTQRP